MAKITVSFKSKKQGRIPSLNIPPVLTCRRDAPCSSLCYARKGTFNYKNVVKSHMDNYIAYNEDQKGFFKEINKTLNNDVVIYKYFRWHMSGDIEDMKYLYGMIELAKKNKKTKFLAFTKKFDLVNMYLEVVDEELPKNLKIVFSAWDKDFKVDNPHNLPISYVNFKNKSLNPSIPENAKKCSGDCSNCRICWNLKNGESTVFDQH